MDVEVPSAKAVTAIRRNLAHVRQHALLETVDMERARVFWLGPLRIVAARDDQHGLIAGRHPDLMEVDAFLEIIRLLHLIANAAVTFDPVNGDTGGEVISDEQVLAGAIDAGVDRSLSQLDQVTIKREFT